jgi:hypothetical protein
VTEDPSVPLSELGPASGIDPFVVRAEISRKNASAVGHPSGASSTPDGADLTESPTDTNSAELRACGDAECLLAGDYRTLGDPKWTPQLADEAHKMATAEQRASGAEKAKRAPAKPGPARRRAKR